MVEANAAVWFIVLHFLAALLQRPITSHVLKTFYLFIVRRRNPEDVSTQHTF